MAQLCLSAVQNGHWIPWRFCRWKVQATSGVRLRGCFWYWQSSLDDFSLPPILVRADSRIQFSRVAETAALGSARDSSTYRLPVGNGFRRPMYSRQRNRRDLTQGLGPLRSSLADQPSFGLVPVGDTAMATTRLPPARHASCAAPLFNSGIPASARYPRQTRVAESGKPAAKSVNRALYRQQSYRLVRRPLGSRPAKVPACGSEGGQRGAMARFIVPVSIKLPNTSGYEQSAPRSFSWSRR